MHRKLRELMQVCFFLFACLFVFFLHFKGVMAYGRLNNFLLVVGIIEWLFFLVNLHQKEILTQRPYFSRYGTDCQNNGLCLSLWVCSRLLLTRLRAAKLKESVYNSWKYHHWTWQEFLNSIGLRFLLFFKLIIVY